MTCQRLYTFVFTFTACVVYCFASQLRDLLVFFTRSETDPCSYFLYCCQPSLRLWAGTRSVDGCTDMKAVRGECFSRAGLVELRFSGLRRGSLELTSIAS